MSSEVDLLVRGSLVNVNTGVIEDREIAIDEGEIVSFTARPAARVIEGEYITPGLIDAHTHVESSMVTIPRYGEAVVPMGVTAVIHDPHEIANVLGEQGVRAFVADANRTPLKAHMTVPSSVPASDLQDTGATVDATSVDALLDHPNAIALGEVMNVSGVLAGEASIHAKIQAARDRDLTVDGHAPDIVGADLLELARYLDNDHESIALEEARSKVDAGLRVYLREGSVSKNLGALVDLVEQVDSRRLSLCTDGSTVTDLVAEGGVNVAVREAMALGVEPVTAIQLATLNVAEAYGLPFGRVEPGAPADMVILSDLESWTVEHVIIDGEVDPTGPADSTPRLTGGPSAIPTDTVTFDPVTPGELAIAHDGTDEVTVRVASAVGNFHTDRMTADVPVIPTDEREGVDVDASGFLGPALDSDVLPMAVIERHGGPGTIGRGFVNNLGLTRGAIGTTVAHDAHNCLVTGTSHEAMARVANHLRDIDGGVAVYDPDTGDCTTLRLPCAGLVSPAPLDEVTTAYRAVDEAASDIGLSVPGGLLELTFLPLEVIPSYRLTNNGLVDVHSFEFVDVVLDS